MITNQDIRRRIGRMEQAYSLATPYGSLEIRPIVSNGAVSNFDPISAVYCPSTEKIYCGNADRFIYSLNPKKTESVEGANPSILHDDSVKYSATTEYDSEYIPSAASANGGMHKATSFTNSSFSGNVEVKFSISIDTGASYYYGYKISKNNSSSSLTLENVISEGCYNANIDKSINRNKPKNISDLFSYTPYAVTVNVDAGDSVEIWVGGAMKNCASSGGSATLIQSTVKVKNFSARALYDGALEEAIQWRGTEDFTRKDYIGNFTSYENKYYIDGVYSPINERIYYAFGSKQLYENLNGGFGIAKLNPHTNIIEKEINLYNFDPVLGATYPDLSLSSMQDSLPLPNKLIYCPTNNKIYVLHGNPVKSWLTVIDPATDEILGSFSHSSFRNSSDMEYSPLNDRIYITNSAGFSISVINPHTQSSITTISEFAIDGPTALLLHLNNNFFDSQISSGAVSVKLNDGSLLKDHELSTGKEIKYGESFSYDPNEETARKIQTLPTDAYSKRWKEKNFNNRQYNRAHTIFDGGSCQKIPYRADFGLAEDEFTIEFWINPDKNYFQTKRTYDSSTGTWDYESYNMGDRAKASGRVAATGGTITVDGDYIIHTFTSSGTFQVTDAGVSGGDVSVEYLVIAGGGAGGHGASGNRWIEAAGGGAGGYLAGTSHTITAQSYAVVVGTGGASSAIQHVQGGDGTNSVFGSYTAIGGGGGGSSANEVGRSGGSGGGSAYSTSPVGSGTSGQGHDGGSGYSGNRHGGGGGGGGGAGGEGGNAGNNSINGGAGGNGLSSSIDGVPTTRAGGGGGSGRGNYGVGGTGGGGRGAGVARSWGSAGAANTGGGGGASLNNNSGAGGSGVVILRYRFDRGGASVLGGTNIDPSTMLLFSLGNTHSTAATRGGLGVVLNQGVSYDDPLRGTLNVSCNDKCGEYSWQTPSSATASNVNPGSAASKAIDGVAPSYNNTASSNSWFSGRPSDGPPFIASPWISFDLGESKCVRSIKTSGSDYYYETYVGDIIYIEVSDDNSNWTLVKSWTREQRASNATTIFCGGGSCHKFYETSFPEVKARYVRLKWSSVSYFAQVAEFWVEAGPTTICDGVCGKAKTISPSKEENKIKFGEWNHIAVVRDPKHTLSGDDFTYSTKLNIYVNGIKWADFDTDFEINETTSPYLYIGGTKGSKLLKRISSIDYSTEELTTGNLHELQTGDAVNIYSRSGDYPVGLDEFHTFYVKKISDYKLTLYLNKEDAISAAVLPPINLEVLRDGDLSDFFISQSQKTGDDWMHYSGLMNGFRFSDVVRYERNFRPHRFIDFDENDEETILLLSGGDQARARNITLDLESVGVLETTSSNTATTDVAWPGASFQLPFGWNDKDMISFKDRSGKFSFKDGREFSITCEANFIAPDKLDPAYAGIHQPISLAYYESDDGKIIYEFLVSKLQHNMAANGSGLYFKQYNEGVLVVDMYKYIYDGTLGNNKWHTFSLSRDSSGKYSMSHNGALLEENSPSLTVYPSSSSDQGKFKIGRGDWEKVIAVSKVDVSSGNTKILKLDPHIGYPGNTLGYAYSDQESLSGNGSPFKEIQNIEIISLGETQIASEVIEDASWKPIKDSSGAVLTALTGNSRLNKHKAKNGLNRGVALFKGDYSPSSSNLNSIRLKSSGSYIKHLPKEIYKPDNTHTWGYMNEHSQNAFFGNNNFFVECSIMPMDFDSINSTSDIASEMGLICFNYDDLDSSSIDWSDCPWYQIHSSDTADGVSSCADANGVRDRLNGAGGIIWTDPWQSGSSNTGKVGWELKINSAGKIEFNFGSQARNTMPGDINHYYNGTARNITSTSTLKYSDWYTVTVSRIGANIYLYINGIQEASINIGEEHVLEHPLMLGLENYDKMGLLIGKSYDGVTASSASSGNLTHIDQDRPTSGGGPWSNGIWADGDFIYLADGSSGLRTYSVDGSGNLTHIDNDDQGVIEARAVWGDGNFIYVAFGEGGLHSYSVDGSGNLTHIDSDDQGDVAFGVWGDGNFIYLANLTGGLHVYSANSAGTLTHIDSDDQGGIAYDVWGDGNFIYLANGTGGLHSYSVDGSGNLTHINSDDQGDTAYDVWGDGTYIYLANGTGGLHSYSVDGSGNLTHINSDDQGDTARAVWGDGNFIYLAVNGSTSGPHSYSVDGSGNLTHIDSDEQGGEFGQANAQDVWGDGNFIYLAESSGGIHSYSVSPPLLSTPYYFTGLMDEVRIRTPNGSAQHTPYFKGDLELNKTRKSVIDTSLNKNFSTTRDLGYATLENNFYSSADYLYLNFNNSLKNKISYVSNTDSGVNNKSPFDENFSIEEEGAIRIRENDEEGLIRVDESGSLVIAGSSKFDLGSEFTIEGWFYRPFLQPPDATLVRRTNSNGGGWDLKLSPNQATLNIYNASGTTSRTITAGLPTNIFDESQWSHFAIQIENSTKVSLVFNGICHAYETITAEEFAHTNLGSNQRIVIGEGGGHFDNFRISNQINYSNHKKLTDPKGKIELVKEPDIFHLNKNNLYYGKHSSSDHSLKLKSDYSNGDLAYLSVDGTDFNFGSEDFTVEFYFRCDSLSELPIGTSVLIGKGNPTSSDHTFYIGLETESVGSGRKTRLVAESGGVKLLAKENDKLDGNAPGPLYFYDLSYFHSSGKTAEYNHQEEDYIIQKYKHVTLCKHTYAGVSYLSLFVDKRMVASNFEISTYDLVSNNHTYTTNLLSSEVFALQSDAADGNTTFTDLSKYTHAITANGNTEHSTDVTDPAGGSKSSMYFDGTGDYLSSTDAKDVANFDDSDWTVEFWIRPSVAFSGTNVFASSGGGVAAWNSTTGHSWSVFSYTDSDIYFQWCNGATTFAEITTANSAVPVGEWTHIAAVNQSGTKRLYIDGVQKVTGTAAKVATSSPSTFTIGDSTASDGAFEGYIHNFNIQHNFCKYKDGTTFTPSISPVVALTHPLTIGTGVSSDGPIGTFFSGNISLIRIERGTNPNLSTAYRDWTFRGVLEASQVGSFYDYNASGNPLMENQLRNSYLKDHITWSTGIKWALGNFETRTRHSPPPLYDCSEPPYCNEIIMTGDHYDGRMNGTFYLTGQMHNGKPVWFGQAAGGFSGHIYYELGGYEQPDLMKWHFYFTVGSRESWIRSDVEIPCPASHTGKIWPVGGACKPEPCQRATFTWGPSCSTSSNIELQEQTHDGYYPEMDAWYFQSNILGSSAASSLDLPGGTELFIDFREGIKDLSLNNRTVSKIAVRGGVADATDTSTKTMHTPPTCDSVAYFGGVSSTSIHEDHASTGGNDYILIDDPKNKWNYFDNDFVISLWVKPEDLSVSPVLFSRSFSDSNKSGSMKLSVTSSGNLKFYRNYFDGNQDQILNVESASPVISENEWTHVQIVRRDNNWDLLINGAVVTKLISGDLSNTPNFTGTNSSIACVGRSQSATGIADPNVVTKSLRFNADAYLSKTFSASTADQKKKTISFWVKRSEINDDGGQPILEFLDGTGTTAGGSISFSGLGGGGSSVNDDFVINNRNATTGTSDFIIRTSELFRNMAEWYHMFIKWDTTQPTAADRIQLWVNGERVTDFNMGDTLYPPLNYVTTAFLASDPGSSAHTMGYGIGMGSANYLEGYLADFHYVDGKALDYNDFATRDGATGGWQPKVYLGSHGDGGFYLDFRDPADIGNDVSGNNNDFSVVTGLSTWDVVGDSPAKNYAVMDPLLQNATTTEGNLEHTHSGEWSPQSASTIVGTSGKYYTEYVFTALGSSYPSNVGLVAVLHTSGVALAGYYTFGDKLNPTNLPGGVAYGASYGVGDIIGVAIDVDNSQVTFYKNNVSQGVQSLASVSGYMPSTNGWSFTVRANFGQDPTFAGNKTSGQDSSQSEFFYKPPTGFVALFAASTFNYHQFKGHIGEFIIADELPADSAGHLKINEGGAKILSPSSIKLLLNFNDLEDHSSSVERNKPKSNENTVLLLPFDGSLNDKSGQVVAAGSARSLSHYKYKDSGQWTNKKKIAPALSQDQQTGSVTGFWEISGDVNSEIVASSSCPIIDNIDKILGAGSGKYDGTCYSIFEDVEDWDLANEDFTIEFWYKKSGDSTPSNVAPFAANGTCIIARQGYGFSKESLSWGVELSYVEEDLGTAFFSWRQQGRISKTIKNLNLQGSPSVLQNSFLPNWSSLGVLSSPEMRFYFCVDNGTVTPPASGAWANITDPGVDGKKMATFTLTLGSPFDNVWEHYAIVRKENEFKTYKNGKLIDSMEEGEVVTRHGEGAGYAWNGFNIKSPANNPVLAIGADTRFINDNWYLKGNLDEIRISKGVARYLEDFEVRTHKIDESAVESTITTGDKTAAITYCPPSKALYAFTSDSGISYSIDPMTNAITYAYQFSDSETERVKESYFCPINNSILISSYDGVYRIYSFLPKTGSIDRTFSVYDEGKFVYAPTMNKMYYVGRNYAYEIGD